MAKFTLYPSGNPDFGPVSNSIHDPFRDAPISVEIPDGPSTSSFLPGPVVKQDPGDLFSALGPSSKPIAGRDFLSVNLAPVAQIEDSDFFGSGPVLKSGSGSTDQFPSAKLAPVENLDCFAGLGPSPRTVDDDALFTKNSAGDFEKFCRFTKVQEQNDGTVLVWGIATLEQPDLDGEICDYDAAKDAYKAWSLAAAQRTSAAGQQISLGPIRYQHSVEPAGKATKIQYNDDDKEIWLGSVPISDDIRNQLQQGFLTGYSQGGSYAWRKCTDCGKSLTLQQANNYCPDCRKNVPVRFGLKRLSEVSYVDSPCTGKGFEYVKHDGTSRFVNFAKRADRSQSTGGVQVLNSRRIYGDCWRHTVQIADRKRFVLIKGDEILLIA